MSKSVVVYDFDKTLTYSDTLLGFFSYVGKRRRLFLPKLTVYLFSMVAAKIGWISNTKLKERGVALFLKGVTVAELEKYAQEYSRTIVPNRLYHELTSHEAQECVCIVVSASFEAYLKPLFEEPVRVVGSSLRYREGCVDGLAFNCYREDKVKALHEAGIFKIDRLYTDSMSDYALAKIAEKIVIVDGDTLTECADITEFEEYFKL